MHKAKKKEDEKIVKEASKIKERVSSPLTHLDFVSYPVPCYAQVLLGYSFCFHHFVITFNAFYVDAVISLESSLCRKNVFSFRPLFFLFLLQNNLLHQLFRGYPIPICFTITQYWAMHWVNNLIKKYFNKLNIGCQSDVICKSIDLHPMSTTREFFNIKAMVNETIKWFTLVEKCKFIIMLKSSLEDVTLRIFSVSGKAIVQAENVFVPSQISHSAFILFCSYAQWHRNELW